MHIMMQIHVTILQISFLDMQHVVPVMDFTNVCAYTPLIRMIVLTSGDSCEKGCIE